MNGIVEITSLFWVINDDYTQNMPLMNNLGVKMFSFFDQEKSNLILLEILLATILQGQFHFSVL